MVVGDGGRGAEDGRDRRLIVSQSILLLQSGDVGAQELKY
jgi:hypothetical protein